MSIHDLGLSQNVSSQNLDWCRIFMTILNLELVSQEQNMAIQENFLCKSYFCTLLHPPSPPTLQHDSYCHPKMT